MIKNYFPLFRNRKTVSFLIQNVKNNTVYWEIFDSCLCWGVLFGVGGVEGQPPPPPPFFLGKFTKNAGCFFFFFFFLKKKNKIL